MKGKNKKDKHPTSKFPIPQQKDLQPLVDAIGKEIKFITLLIDGVTWERDDIDPSVATLTLRMFCPRCGVRGPVTLSVLMDDPKKLPKFERLAKSAAKEIFAWYERSHHVVADAQRALAGPKPPAPDISAIQPPKPNKPKKISLGG